MVMEAVRISHKQEVHNDNSNGQKVNHGFDINEPEVNNGRAKQRQQPSAYAHAGFLSKLTFWLVEWLFTFDIDLSIPTS